jgi:hypothetical protein
MLTVLRDNYFMLGLLCRKRIRFAGFTVWKIIILLSERKKNYSAYLQRRQFSIFLWLYTATKLYSVLTNAIKMCN